VGAVAQRQCISQSALKRLPDGETGIRKTWIRFLQRSFRRQHSQVLADNPAIEVASDVPPFKFTQWDGKVLQLDGRRGRAARLASHAGAEFRCVVSTRDQRRPVGRHHIVVVGAIGVGSEIWNLTTAGITPSCCRRSNSRNDSIAKSAIAGLDYHQSFRAVGNRRGVWG
jgi:hypothetical protein